MNPLQTLLNNEDVIRLVLEHQYLPEASSVGFAAILGAVREINPQANYDAGCSGCMSEIIKTANIYLQDYKKTI